jgi:2-oxoglutarate dehydrogenase E2 component (dihydrolipoamide succinyltransferase)
MKVDIKVPAMGESISEASVGQILKPAGSRVEADDEIIELETEKVNQVIYAPQAGIVQWNVAAGDVVKIGQILGQIDTSGTAEKVKPSAEPVKQDIPEKKTEAAAKAIAPSTDAVKTSQTTTGARITRQSYIDDVISEQKSAPVEKQEAKKSTADVPPKTPSPQAKPIAPLTVPGERRETRKKMSKVRQVIARRLVEAQQSTAMLTTFNEVDMTQVMGLREKYKDLFLKTHGVKLGFMSFFVKSCVMALTEFPGVNSYIDGDEIVHREYYDIGVAVGTDKGLFVPVVRDCDHLSFAGIESAIEGYAKRAKEGTLTMNDLQGGGFTVTNGGVYGSLLSTPILNPPQAGILGMHKILKRAVVVNDQIVIRPMMYLALSYDHRIVDGKEAVSFLVKVKESLEDPARFVLDV